MPLRQENGFYYVSVNAGSPPQYLECFLDMSSSDSIFLANTAPVCSSQVSVGNGTAKSPCDYTFNPHASSSIYYYPQGFPTFDSFYYNASGVFVADTMSIEFLGASAQGVKLNNMTFGLAEQNGKYLTSCMIGLGLQAGELSVTTLENGLASPVYNNVPMVIRDSGLTHRVSYSVYLSRTLSYDGFVLFGGVDHSKYSGNLSIVPLVDYATDTRLGKAIVGEPTDFQVALSGISIQSNGTTISVVSNARLPTSLAFGMPVTQLPTAIANQMAHILGMYFDTDAGIYWASCDRDAEIIFDLSGAEIRVPLKTFMVETGLQMSNGEPACAVLMTPQDDPLWVLGDPFLRAAYLYADLESFEMAIAQAIHSDSDEAQYEAAGPLGAITNATRAPFYAMSGLSSQFNISSGNHTFYPVVQLSRACLNTPTWSILLAGLFFALL